MTPARNRVMPTGDIEAIALRVPSAKQMNRRLHDERIVRGTHRRRVHELSWAELPDGAFALLRESPVLVVGDHLAQWTREGYRGRRARPARGTATVITPPSTIAALRTGYPVQLDAGAYVESSAE